MPGMSDLRHLIELVDQAIGRASDSVGPEPLAEAAAMATGARRRVGYLGNSVVVALAGGTGSGKSSLLNAVAGAPVAEVAAIRPTTSEPLAWMPDVPEPGVVRLLDDMGIEHRVGHRHRLPVVLIDMPDTDSVVGAHRAIFESLLPRVDLVWWVVDPEKYSDRLLHREYLGPLSEYQAQFLFVFNQIDRLSPPELAEVIADFKHRLSDVGIADPSVVAVAANPPDGPALNIDLLHNSLAEMGDAKQAVSAKTIVDMRRAAAMVGEVTGVSNGPIGFDERWDGARTAVVDGLIGMVVAPDVVTTAENESAAQALRMGSGPLGWLAGRLKETRIARAIGLAAGPKSVQQAAAEWEHRPGRDRALSILETAVSDVALATGGSFSSSIRAEFDSNRIASAVDATVDVALHRTAQLPVVAPRWWSTIAVIKWLLAVAVVGGAVWWYAQRPVRGEAPWSVVIVIGGLLVGFALSRLSEWSGRRRARRSVADFRRAVAADLESEIDRSLGHSLRAAVRSRAELAALLGEVSMEADRLQSA